ncbi:hypothetical protein GAU_0212 [Gemmatimonas aurantiaca T-27]|uniref:DUF305 domain-containing protein n=2 Tax=Gemmatimonas aurantiaca TaxID=173480 RepID=C1A4U4_GEMAT|nr:DUF305 domain-containing protein [Gemmatimonas aurantiaca]BAH37254.1 hypothetical protein GAU_0212 [Gemmatimonas aurantiaca T-27]
MTIPANRFVRPAAIIAAALVLGACASGRQPGVSSDPRFQMGDAGAIARARADSLRYPYTKADIDFMSGMIHHHAQAITISRWAPTHGASASVQRLTARIINAQTDEINIMQTWLKDRLQPIPVVDSLGQVTMQGAMAGMSHDAHAGHGGATNAHGQMEMPGMLTAAQLAELDGARGADFDRLFLTYMIQHHRGAVTMVKVLFNAPGAGQDETIFKFANDVEVDQGTEIKRMMSMMLDMGFVPPSE